MWLSRKPACTDSISLVRHISTRPRHVSPPISLRKPTSPKPTPPVVPQPSLSQHWETTRPAPSLYTLANKTFTRHPATHLWTAGHFRQTPQSAALASAPEVAFLGRSNVGKSSLLNAVFGYRFEGGEGARVGKKPGRTRTMVAFGVGGSNNGKEGGRVTILDMPGYGKGSRPEWGAEVIKYLTTRRQLRRAFLLVDAEHGLKESDRALLALLRRNAVPHQILLSKVDKVLWRRGEVGKKNPRVARLEGVMERIREESRVDELGPGPAPLDEMWGFAARMAAAVGGSRTLGIEGVRVAVLRAAGLEGSRRGMEAEIAVEEEMLSEQELKHEARERGTMEPQFQDSFLENQEQSNEGHVFPWER